MVVPEIVKKLLAFRKFSLLKPAVPFYKLARLLNLDSFIKDILLPSAYKKEIKELVDKRVIRRKRISRQDQAGDALEKGIAVLLEALQKNPPKKVTVPPIPKGGAPR